MTRSEEILEEALSTYFFIKIPLSAYLYVNQ